VLTASDEGIKLPKHVAELLDCANKYIKTENLDTDPLNWKARHITAMNAWLTLENLQAT
jgi:hypothetical protein